MRTNQIPLVSMLVSGALALALPIASASAATQQECQSAIDALEAQMASDAGFQMMPQGRQDEVQSILAEAGEANLQGNYERCLERVESARGAAGLRG